MINTKALVATGDLPSIQEWPDHQDSEAFEHALCSGQGAETKFRSIYNLFSRATSTDFGTGEHYIVGMVGTVYAGARETVMAVAEHQRIPVLDMTRIPARTLLTLPVRALVQVILETPPLCAIIVALDNTGTAPSLKLQKVINRLAKRQLDLRFRRVVFCLMDSVECHADIVHNIAFPGSTEDKLQMLLYRTPVAFRQGREHTDRFRSIAEAMVDYSVFQPKIWQQVDTRSTLEDFLSTLTFQVHRHSTVELENTLDVFPSFEAGWRRAFSADLDKQLKPAPDRTCRGIHRVLPAGVSRDEGIKCIQTAIPRDLNEAYTLTVASTAVDDQCGSIYVTQRTQHTIIHLHCTVDPGILSQVCSELRKDNRLIVQELAKNAVALKVVEQNSGEITAQLASLKRDWKTEVEALKELIVHGKRSYEPDQQQCAKKFCTNVVVDRFSSGRLKKQCSECISLANQARKKAKRLA
jgi:hypothetical protein